MQEKREHDLKMPPPYMQIAINEKGDHEFKRAKKGIWACLEGRGN